MADTCTIEKSSSPAANPRCSNALADVIDKIEQQQAIAKSKETLLSTTWSTVKSTVAYELPAPIAAILLTIFTRPAAGGPSAGGNGAGFERQRITTIWALAGCIEGCLLYYRARSQQQQDRDSELGLAVRGIRRQQRANSERDLEDKEIYGEHTHRLIGEKGLKNADTIIAGMR